jgi:FixJ family two-component response regulator
MSGEALVHIVDDDPAVRGMLVATMQQASLPAAGYSSAENFIQKQEWDAQGCLVLDLSMQGMGGPRAAQAVAGRGQ